MDTSTLPISVLPTATSSNPPTIESSAQSSNQHAIFFFENELPPGLEDEMTAMYANFFSAPAKFRAYGQLSDVSTYVARVNDQATAIFVVRIDGKKIHVLNEQIHIPQSEITRFAQYMFDKYRKASMICFKTVQTQLSQFPYPYQRVYFTNDVVLPLPNSVPDYLASLGKSTRENIKRYLKLLKRDFPSYSFDVTETDQGGDDRFRTIIDFNHARMTGKNKISGITSAEAKRLHDLVKECGLISTVTINGRVSAGTICYRIGDNYFMRVIAHDSAYNDYRVGVLCCYLTICECIARGGKNYHFLWGREEYKYRFLGQHRDFDSLTIYRSPMHQFADLRSIMKVAAKAKINKTKLWLLDPANSDKALARTIRRSMAWASNLKKKR